MRLPEIVLKVLSFRKAFFQVLFILSITNLLFAADPGANFRVALGSLCKSALGVLAIGAIVLIVMAAIVYAVGQMLGAETRARATVWATAMFTGAIVAAIIFVVVPWLISIIMTGTPNGDWVKNCCVDNPEPDCAGLGSGPNNP